MTRRDFFPECKRATALLYDIQVIPVTGCNLLIAKVGKRKTYSFHIYFPFWTIAVGCERELS
jgi:hypothetical protein